MWSARLPALLTAALLLACSGGPALPDTELDDGPPVPPPGGGGGGPGGQTPPGETPPGQDPPPLAAPAWPPLQVDVEHLDLAFGADTAAKVYVPWQKEYLPGRFRLHGQWHDVSLRMRGDGAQLHPKHSWKVKLEKDDLVDGRRIRNFLAEYPDGGYLSDPFMVGLMVGAGVPMADFRYVTLAVNGQAEGVYVDLEEPDTKPFLVKHGLDPESNVYRCGLRDCELKVSHFAHYQGPWEKKTNEREPPDDLDAFLRGLARTPEHELPAWLARHVDLDRFVRFYAVGIVVSLSGVDDSGSYLVHDRARDRWVWVPWDLNNARLVFWRNNPAEWGVSARSAIPFYTLYDPETLGVAAGKEARYGGAHPPFVVLFQRVWDVPALRTRILDEVETLLDGVFSEAQAGVRIDRLRALVAPRLPADPWVSQPHADASAQVLKDYVRNRITFLRAAIPAERRRGEGGLVVNAVGPDFVELYNREDVPRDLGGLALTGDLRDRLAQPLAAGTVVPARGAVRLPFRAPPEGGEVGLFSVETRLAEDAAFFAPLRGRVYGRIPDGAETWGWR